MYGQREIISPEQEFWNWFQAKEVLYRTFDAQVHQERLDKFLTQLHYYHPKLSYSLGGHPKAQKKELIITAEGHTENFAAVERLVAKAPLFANWIITAFKPAKGFDFTVEYGNIILNPEELYFAPIAHSEKPDLIGIRVFVEDFEEEKVDMYYGGMNLLLQTALGEKAATRDLEYWDITEMPTDYDYHIHPLKEIVRYIKWKKEN